MERTPLFYLANLGSEINRIFSLKERGMEQEAYTAYLRAMTLIEKILNHPESNDRTIEIELLKKYLEKTFQEKQLSSLKNEWGIYFMPYAKRLLLTKHE